MWNDVDACGPIFIVKKRATKFDGIFGSRMVTFSCAGLLFWVTFGGFANHFQQGRGGHYRYLKDQTRLGPVSRVVHFGEPKVNKAFDHTSNG